MKTSALWSCIKDVFRVQRLRAELDLREAELAKERSDLSQLGCSLDVERRHLCASEAVVERYERTERQLRAAVEEIAIPALREHEARSNESPGQLTALEDALPDPVDEREIREQVWTEYGSR